MTSLSEVILQRGTDPGLRLIAAVVAMAIDDSRAGDESAWRWLCDHSRPWLSWLLPDGLDLDELHRRIVDYARPRRPLQRQLEMSA